MKSMVSVETTEGVEAVTDTALTYQLLSQYTAFVTVSDDVRVNSESVSVSMQVPVEMPEGISYQGVYSSFGSSSFASLRAQPSYSQSEFGDIGNSGPFDMFDITLISPGMMIDDESEDSVSDDGSLHQLASPSPFSSQLEIISVTGLEAAATASLTEYLQKLSLPVGFSGEIVFEFPVQKGRVKRIMLDEKASTLKEATVIDLIKRSLLSWQVPQSVTGTIRLTLRINS